MNKTFNKIFFDFDSTLIKAESLDLLGELCGVGAKVRKLTAASMSGAVPLEQIFKKKVDMISPSREQVRKIAKNCTGLFVADIQEVISALHGLRKEIYILSSNFHQIIEPSANILGIPKSWIIANNLYFTSKGGYRGFTHESLLCSSLGKGAVLKKYLKKNDHSAFIGDGRSDLSAKGVVDLFIGFGGVEQRLIVKRNADLYISAPTLAPVLLMLLTNSEIMQLKKKGFEKLLKKAEVTTTTTTTKPPGSR